MVLQGAAVQENNRKSAHARKHVNLVNVQLVRMDVIAQTVKYYSSENVSTAFPVHVYTMEYDSM